MHALDPPGSRVQTRILPTHYSQVLPDLHQRRPLRLDDLWTPGNSKLFRSVNHMAVVAHFSPATGGRQMVEGAQILIRLLH